MSATGGDARSDALRFSLAIDATVAIAFATNASDYLDYTSVKVGNGSELPNYIPQRSRIQAFGRFLVTRHISNVQAVELVKDFAEEESIQNPENTVQLHFCAIVEGMELAAKLVWTDKVEVISRKVLVDEGSRQLVEVEQSALWRFLWWSGTFPVHVIVDQNREDHSMKFKQVKAGFMKRFEGCWIIDPLFVDKAICFPFKPKTLTEYDSCTRGRGRVGSIVSLCQLIQPALVPPPPISWYLRGITTRTTEMLITDLVIEAARIRGDFGTKFHQKQELLSQGTVNENPVINDLSDVKERWAQRRNMRRHKNHRRLQWD
ncbi:hypothetical protein GIB67_042698 [Kingdonia uniflora]|uniref:DUF220 domain-containing protein n=1 Tax=Kingdonia uniflora TaxID=39325 RepID=A0A7J7NE80_9MAGN|nr:hypothetical protein GIB67_042698 [Kingdonia uniflora]